MATMTLRASGPVGADEAWDRYADLTRWTTWAPQISSVQCDAARLAAGVTGRVSGPVGISVDFVVDAWDDVARTWSWTARRGPIRVRLEHGVETRGDGSATWLTMRGLLPELVLYAPVAKLALRRLVNSE